MKNKVKPGCGLPLILGVVTFVLLGIGMRGSDPTQVSVSPSPTPVFVTSSSEIEESSPMKPVSTSSPTPEPENTIEPTATPAPTPAETPAAEPTTPPESSEPTQTIVYWTPNGKSYHSTEYCRTLSRSKTILSGTIDEAIATGHGDPCNVCH